MLIIIDEIGFAPFEQCGGFKPYQPTAVSVFDRLCQQ